LEIFYKKEKMKNEMENKSQGLVSVIAVTYNSSQFIIETLESIKAQTWRNIELIVTDDASQDNTVPLCIQWLEENGKRFARTELITVPHNTGIPSNCNRGFKASRGEWVKMVSGDDVLLENCITDNLEYVKRYPEASFITSDVIEIDEDSRLLRENVINEGLIFITKRKSAKKQLKAYSRWPAFINSPAFFYKKELIDAIGYCDDEFRIYDDICMLLRVLDKDNRIHYMNKPTVKYRIHQNSVSRSTSIEEKRGKEVLRIFKKYRQENLNILNPIDLSVYYENWLRFKYKGF